MLGKIAVVNDRLARRVTIGAKASPHDLSSDVGMKSSGDDFLDIAVSNRRTSSTVTGATTTTIPGLDVACPTSSDWMKAR